MVKKITALLEFALPVLAIKQLVRARWLILLALLAWVNAILVALFTHQSRTETALLEQLKHEQYQLEMEWEALRLEQGALAEHHRIAELAKEKLAMRAVARKDEKVIEAH
ncbi:cell division protein FtsL [Pleionea sp. CnH1-48]|uniref:cell division protein FtsL n=1 Tax=Pleionea sp. CnH1-48 TaxID=2954494 RepID=UPI00209750A2|nr:cell division protein FtsL [Pleionea sp. CnH1-48]MCO7223999.1 cell division protein FtsL [Pleionea sp. CnH1-48]